MARTPLQRYERLGIEESLSRTYEYPIVCRELSFILRGAYSKLPKNLQSLIFQHTLTAFRLLPQMQTQSAVSAANVLIQSAEAVLPKQRKVLAGAEFKHSIVSHKRRSKDRQDKGSPQLPQDVIVHIFSFLDLRSLLSAASVCWSWNLAARDNHLWRLLHIIYFGESNYALEVMRILLDNDIDWRGTFKETYEGSSIKKFISDRRFCEHCDTIVRLGNMECSDKYCRINFKYQQIKALSPERIVEYILNGTASAMSSSENDSDSDDESISKLWATPRYRVGWQ